MSITTVNTQNVGIGLIELAHNSIKDAREGRSTIFQNSNVGVTSWQEEFYANDKSQVESLELFQIVLGRLLDDDVAKLELKPNVNDDCKTVTLKIYRISRQ